MKKQILAMSLFLAVLLSCSVAPKVVIPDEPAFKRAEAVSVEGGICFRSDAFRVLMGSFGEMKAYADALRKELERVRDGK